MGSPHALVLAVTLEGWIGAIAVGAVLGISVLPPGFVLRKWRGLMAWLSGDDLEAAYQRLVARGGIWPEPAEGSGTGVSRSTFAAEVHVHHCPTCAASRVPDSLRTDYERALIAKEWTAHYKGPARG